MNFKLDLTQIKDIAERAVMTAIQTFLALVVVSDLSSAKTAAAAAVAAGLSVLKGAVAAGGPLGDATASLLKLGKGDK